MEPRLGLSELHIVPLYDLRAESIGSRAKAKAVYVWVADTAPEQSLMSVGVRPNFILNTDYTVNLAVWYTEPCMVHIALDTEAATERVKSPHATYLPWCLLIDILDESLSPTKFWIIIHYCTKRLQILDACAPF